MFSFNQLLLLPKPRITLICFDLPAVMLITPNRRKHRRNVDAITRPITRGDLKEIPLPTPAPRLLDPRGIMDASTAPILQPIASDLTTALLTTNRSLSPRPSPTRCSPVVLTSLLISTFPFGRLTLLGAMSDI